MLKSPMARAFAGTALAVLAVLGRGLPLSAQTIPATAPAAVSAGPTADWRETYAYTVGMQAVIFGYPVVKNMAVRFSMVEKPNGLVDTPLNQWFHSRRAADHTDRIHSSVTSDLLYSSAWYDLRKEPLVITVPESAAAYYSVQFMEMYSDIFAYLGTRATGAKAGSYLLVGPDWSGETPAGLLGVIRSPTPTGMLLLRTGFADRTKLDGAHRLQDGNRLLTLSKWQAHDSSPETARDVLNPATPATSALPFFASLNRGMTENPPPPRDAALVALFASVGIGPGQSDDFSRTDPATRRGLQRAMVDGLAFLRQVSAAGGDTKQINGWAYGQLNWGRTAARADFLTRSATQSFSGMQEHHIEEVVKLRAHRDGDGALLDGAAGRYTIRFAPDQIPQAKAFWSVTVYNSDYDLVENPLGRYSRGGMDSDMKRDRDGGLTLYLQADAPDRTRVGNWLPIPRGAFNLFLRAYLPDEQLMRQDYVPPMVRKVS